MSVPNSERAPTNTTYEYDHERQPEGKETNAQGASSFLSAFEPFLGMNVPPHRRTEASAGDGGEGEGATELCTVQGPIRPNPKNTNKLS